MLDNDEIVWIHWDSSIQKRLIGRGTPYPAIRMLIEYIVSIQRQIKEANQIYDKYKDEHISIAWLDNSQTARGIEELGYKSYISILKTKHKDALLSLNRFRNVSDQIPQLCGQVNCILDYIMHGARWVWTEIRCNEIANRMDKENCIAYVNEANKLIGGCIRYNYE